MYLTAEQYATYAGESAPPDFTACLDMAEAMIDLYTMNFYAQETLSELPERVLATLRRAVAYQVQAISQAGGVASMTEPQVKSASIGKVSYSVDATPVLCAPAAMLVPYLNAYARGATA